MKKQQNLFLLLLLSSMIAKALSQESTEESVQETITIALNVALTGMEVEGDRGIINGAKLAAAKANNQGGIAGKPVKIILIDNQGTDLGARFVAKQAVKTNALAMVGAGRSSRTLVSAHVAQKAKMPMVSPFSTHPGITKVGKYIFRVGFTDELQGKTLGAYARQSLKAHRVIVIENISEEYSTILADHFLTSFIDLNGSLAFRGYYHRKSMDFSHLIESIKYLEHDLIFLPGYSKRSALFIKQAKSSGIHSTILGGDGWGVSMFGFAGHAMNGHFSADHWHKSIDTEESKKFVAAYKKAYGTNQISSTGSALAYDAINLILYAASKVEQHTRDSIQEALSNIKAFNGVTGTIGFNRFGDPVNKPVIITQYHKNNKNLVSSFAYPVRNE